MPKLEVNLAIVLALKVGLLAPMTLGADPDPVNQSRPLETNKPKLGALDAPPNAAVSAPVEPGPKAQEPLTDPNIGRALEAFKPSESISADNAVPFPINI